MADTQANRNLFRDTPYSDGGTGKQRYTEMEGQINRDIGRQRYGK